MEIIRATSPNEIEEVRRLFREYEAFLNVDLRFQQFETELANLPGKYAPPSGILLLARIGEKALGCGALRKLDAAGVRVCEMKRLYTRPEARGLGLGRKIATRLIREGIRLGYTTMLLDTFHWLEEAVHLYESLGFVPTDPYYDNPLPGVIYWKRDLKGEIRHDRQTNLARLDHQGKCGQLPGNSSK